MGVPPCPLTSLLELLQIPASLDGGHDSCIAASEWSLGGHFRAAWCVCLPPSALWRVLPATTVKPHGLRWKVALTGERGRLHLMWNSVEEELIDPQEQPLNRIRIFKNETGKDSC